MKISKEELKNILITKDNIKTLEKRDNKSYNIKKLLSNNNIDQSQSIRFGNLFQDFIMKSIKMAGGEIIDIGYINVTDKEVNNSRNNKDKKDIDILFKYDNITYYYEVKTNLNLDSEKYKATDVKVKEITRALIANNHDPKIKHSILTCWYENEYKLPIKVKTNITFMKDIFKILNIDCNKEDYYTLMKEFGEKI